MDTELMLESLPKLLGAVPETLILVTSSLLLGFILSVAIALARLSQNGVLSRLSYGFVYIFRSTPLLVQMFLIFYGSGQYREFLESVGLWVLFKEPWFCAILALTLNTGAYTSEIIRGGIQSVPQGQVEAGLAAGMSKGLLFRHIIFPLAMRQALPAYGNEVILMVKATSLASTITLLEVTGISKKIIAETWSPVEVFIIAGAIYLALNFIVTRAILLAEKRMHKDRKSASVQAQLAEKAPA